MSVLTAAAIDSALILALALGATALLRRRSAALRHWVVASAVGCAILMPALELLLPAWPLASGRSQWTTTVVSAGVLARLESTAAGNPNTPGDLSTGESWIAAALSAAGRALEDGGPLLLAIWAAGTALLLLLLGLSLLRVRQLARSAERADDPEWLAAAADIARLHGVGRCVVLLRCAHPAMVLTWGLTRARVLLPATARDWSTDRLRVVLCHELAHARRHDWAIQIAAAIARAMYWFNPLAWAAGAVLRRESERACDDLVLASGVSGTDYATHLVAVARDAVHARRAWPAAAIAEPSSLEGRVRAMLNTSLDRKPLTHVRRAAAGALLLLVALVLSAASLSREAAAQGGVGTIAAAVYDQSGGRLPDVGVHATHVETGRTHQATTDRTGSFALENVQTGVYELTMSRPGFAAVRSTIDLQPGDMLQRNIVLPLGNIEESITIIGPDAPGVASASPAAPRARPARELPQPRAAGLGAGNIGGNIRMPLKLVDVKPIFPAELGGSSATVTLSGRIGIDGFLIDLKDVSQPRPHPAFVASLLAAVREWEFDPTYLNGTPVETNITITGRFTSR